MSVGSITSSTSTLPPAVTGGQQSTGTTAKSGAAGGGGSSADGSATVSNVTQQTNADGTITVVTTYADGTTSSTTEPNPNPVTASSSLFSGSNSGQLATLLGAQEQSQQDGSTSSGS